MAIIISFGIDVLLLCFWLINWYIVDYHMITKCYVVDHHMNKNVDHYMITKCYNVYHMIILELDVLFTFGFVFSNVGLYIYIEWMNSNFQNGLSWFWQQFVIGIYILITFVLWKYLIFNEPNISVMKLLIM